MSDGGITKAEMRQAIIRTATTVHLRHDRTGGRAIPAAAQDNDCWPSAAQRDAVVAFARQAFSRHKFPSGRTEGTGAATIHGAAPAQIHEPDQTLPLSEPSGTAGAASVPVPLLRRRSGLFVQPIHNGGITHA